MKSKTFTLFSILIFFLISSVSYSQNEPYYYIFNTVNYFAPADSHSSSVNKTSYEKSEVTIDLNTNKIIIKVNYSDGPVESVYTIKKISELNNNYNDGQYYTFTCLASNYAEVIIDVSKEANWVKRKITHNGITHKYYNR